ncbi:DUF4189 domain-containing protein [Acuticoccus sp. I52.16.1]|uniref:DUF4189 domain-containing protein n=1 Tax=Acuticoccus sp. I52.16.1 TaxID=2928472 RepID=UPI001FD1CAAA|nr:DUF4189 domain-containing protein [Acuticoccus sp. I52.16.1]UOM35611.1 DUF4189 domain-containing protein [Acuticoccus sp. I52.16.1]
MTLLRMLLLVALGAVLPATTAAADDNSYGAVGVDPHNASVVFITEKASRNQAMDAVQALCQEHNMTCEVTKPFHDGCASLARSTDGSTYGLGFEATPASSQTTALDECTKEGGTGCNIHDTYCSPANLGE